MNRAQRRARAQRYPEHYSPSGGRWGKRGPNTGATVRQLQVLRLIAESLRTRGASPAIREILSSLGLSPKSKNAVTGYVAALLRRGLITKEPAKLHAISVTDAGSRALGKVCPTCGATAHGVYMDLTVPTEQRAFRCAKCPPLAHQ